MKLTACFSAEIAILFMQTNIPDVLLRHILNIKQRIMILCVDNNKYPTVNCTTLLVAFSTPYELLLANNQM